MYPFAGHVPGRNFDLHYAVNSAELPHVPPAVILIPQRIVRFERRCRPLWIMRTGLQRDAAISHVAPSVVKAVSVTGILSRLPLKKASFNPNVSPVTLSVADDHFHNGPVISLVLCHSPHIADVCALVVDVIGFFLAYCLPGFLLLHG